MGGGFTGLSTALHAATAGIDCHLLEARRIGHGGSGRNVGLVNAGLWLPPSKVRARLGAERGDALIARLGAAPDLVYGLIETHQIRCEARRGGTIHAAHAPRGYAELAQRAADWQNLGAPVELLPPAAAAARIGSQAFHGGLFDARAGTINPMGYARGLARAARAAGARISVDTPVLSLRPATAGWALATPAGTLTARQVVLATNAYSDALWPGLAASYTPLEYFQLATEPLGERSKTILPGGEGLWDTGTIMFSLRRDAEGRLIVGSMGREIGGNRGLSRRWATRRLTKLFPDLGPVHFTDAWHGRIAMTPDHLPRIHRLAEGVHTAIGYNGRGIGPGTVFGQALAPLAGGGDPSDLPLPVSDLTPAPLRALRSRFYRTVFAANQTVGSL